MAKNPFTTVAAIPNTGLCAIAVQYSTLEDDVQPRPLIIEAPAAQGVTTATAEDNAFMAKQLTLEF